MFHGQSGFATSHFKRWKSTPVQPDTWRQDEATTRYIPNRVDPELCDRSGGGNYWADHRIPLFWHHNLAARHWANCLDFYWNFNSALLRAATAV
jgi:hypothetical protein